ncbi:MAG TPA: glycosyltransferase family 2 protein [candidate division Zixibacteria bacterium]|nr:glycosyltransferase family 2 protein [candidate division Zixibacteria bacterium]
MGRPDSWREIYDVRAIILAKLVRKNYFEELLENNQSSKGRAENKKRQHKSSKESEDTRTVAKHARRVAVGVLSQNLISKASVGELKVRTVEEEAPASVRRKGGSMTDSVISVVIPAYNEEKSIGTVIEETTQVLDGLGAPYEIIVVDDGSIDNTARVASTYKTTVISYPKNMGKGYAVRKGIERAQGEIIVTIDADGSHRPKEIPDLVIPAFNGTDIVAGSRFLGSGTDFTTRINRIGNFVFNATIAGLTGRLVTDSQTGFRAINKEALKKMNLTSNGFEIESEITVKGLRNGFKFQEKPITCGKRQYDLSRLKIARDGPQIFKAIVKSSFSKIKQ